MIRFRSLQQGGSAQPRRAIRKLLFEPLTCEPPLKLSKPLSRLAFQLQKTPRPQLFCLVLVPGDERLELLQCRGRLKPDGPLTTKAAHVHAPAVRGAVDVRCDACLTRLCSCLGCHAPVEFPGF